MKSPSVTSPLHLPVSVVKLPKAGMPIDLDASAEEREALSADIGIVGIERMQAALLVAPWKRDGISVRGRLQAVVLQASVITLEPVRQTIDEAVDFVFLPENSRLSRPEGDGGELFIDPEGDDLPETFSGDRIDLGPYLAELLVLALDPYPRGGAEDFGGASTDRTKEERPVSAFDVLRQLRTDPSKESGS